MAQRPNVTSQSVRPDFAELNDLVCEKSGGEVLFSTDDWFAESENLLKTEPAVFKAELFTPFGKWMDGWETRRKRIPGHDWCIIKLGIPGLIKGFDFDTSFFTGNYAPRVSVQAASLDESVKFPARSAAMGTAATNDQLEAMKALKTEEWQEVLNEVELKPGYVDTCHNFFACNSRNTRWTHIRVNIYPDGGIARLHVFGQAVPDWSKVSKNTLIDLVAMVNGGVSLGYSDVHFGHARNLIREGRSSSMADGWETARRLDRPSILEADDKGVLIVPGKEWCVFRLGHPGIIKNIEIDTNHFKGNYPDSCYIEGCVMSEQDEEKAKAIRVGKAVGDFSQFQWKMVLPPSKLSAHKCHRYKEDVVKCDDIVTHVRLTMQPDGGISRMRLYGNISNSVQ